MVKLIGFVTNDEVPMRNGGQGANPVLVPIVDAAIENLGQWQKLEVDDKKEGERVRESLRNQLKHRGFNVTCATDAKMVKVRNKATKEITEKLKHYVFLVAYAKDLGNGKEEEAVPAAKRKHTKKVVTEAATE